MNPPDDRVDHPDPPRAPVVPDPAAVAELNRLGLVQEPHGPDHDVRHDHLLRPDHDFRPGPQPSHPVMPDIL